ncbi:MAG: PDZ domain-containing protein [Vicinamibacterales bacterium]
MTIRSVWAALAVALGATALTPGIASEALTRTSVDLAGTARAEAETAPETVDSLFEAFWDATSAKDAAKVTDRIVKAGLGFDEVFERLERGRPYKAKVATGEVRWIGHAAGLDAELTTRIVVPKDYDSTERYPVRVQLHGGVAREAPRENRSRRSLESSRATIHVMPTGYAAAQWWFANQIDNIERLIDRLKRTYNVDENRVHLIGVSDGGTGTYFFAFRDTTPWAAFVPLNGFPRVLANPSVGTDGELYSTNLANKPLFVINGGRDPLYPASAVVPYLEMFQKAGAAVTFRPKINAGHDTSWWDEEQFTIDDFVDDHPRDPLPDRLSWQTERTDRYNRAHWLVIDELDASRSEAPLEDVNTIQKLAEPDFGMRVDSRVSSGTKVVDVIANTDAQQMGLLKADLITEVDGRRVGSGADIVEAMQRHEDGEPIRFVVQRRSEKVTLSIPFPPKPHLPPPEAAFPRLKASGRVDIERQGNRVEARTKGVGTFTLLLSPRRFELDKPVVVTVNGREVFNGRVQPDVATLLRWAARDNDRTMLFGAELRIEVPARTAS